MIIVAAIAFDRHTTFPGMAALVPVVGTVLVLACGNESRIASGLLRTRPLQWFGDVSYVWYLWHWPVLVFADVLVPDLTVGAVSASACCRSRSRARPAGYWKIGFGSRRGSSPAQR